MSKKRVQYRCTSRVLNNYMASWYILLNFSHIYGLTLVAIFFRPRLATSLKNGDCQDVETHASRINKVARSRSYEVEVTLFKLFPPNKK
jgi:hypothetical protein